MTYEELKKHAAEKVDSGYTRDICSVLKSLIGIFKKLHFADKVYYKKIVVRRNTDMQKLWPFVELLATNNTTDYWLEYTRYEDSRNQYNVYGLLFGTNARRYGGKLEEPIEIAIKRLLLEHYKPECMPDSDTFLDNYSKHMADNHPPSTFPPVVLWYEFLLKLAQEPRSFIETTPLDGPLKPDDFPCAVVVTQIIKNDVCEASIAALEYLLDKAERRYKQAEKPTETGRKDVELKTVHKALIKALSEILKAGSITEITRDALVRKTSYAVGSGNVNQAYIDLKELCVITQDGQSFTPNFQHYKQNPPD